MKLSLSDIEHEHKKLEMWTARLTIEKKHKNRDFLYKVLISKMEHQATISESNLTPKLIPGKIRIKSVPGITSIQLEFQTEQQRMTI